MTCFSASLAAWGLSTLPRIGTAATNLTIVRRRGRTCPLLIFVNGLAPLPLDERPVQGSSVKVMSASLR
jgi:hypothetical protein